MTRTAIVGGFSDSVAAQVALNTSLSRLAADGDIVFEWIATPVAESTDFFAHGAAAVGAAPGGKPHPIVAAFAAACRVFKADRSAQLDANT